MQTNKFRFGGRGGHKYKGSIQSSLGGKYNFSVKFNQKELEQLMKDIAPEAEQKIKTAIRKSNDEVIKHLKAHGRQMSRDESNRAYNKITKDLHQSKKLNATRIAMKPEFGPPGRVKKAGRGRRLMSLHLLYRAPVPAWYYAEEIYRGMPVVSSSNYFSTKKEPLRLKKRGRKKKYPGIKMNQTMDWVAMAEHMAPPIIVDKINKELKKLVERMAGKPNARQKRSNPKLKRSNTGAPIRKPLIPAPVSPKADAYMSSIINKFKSGADTRRRGV